MLNVNQISHTNVSVKKQTNNVKRNATAAQEQNCDTISFKGKIKAAPCFGNLLLKLLGAGALAGAGIELSNQSSALENKAKEDFDNMKNMRGFWLQNYSCYPDLLEKILLEKEGVTKPRLFDVSQESVMRIFSKDEEALKRIYTSHNIFEIELKNFKNNKYGQSLIELLGEKYPDILDSVMFQKNEYDDSTILTPIRQFIDTETTNAHCLEHLNKAYKNRLDTLAEIYLLKDDEQKYPLYYTKNLPQDVQEKIIENIRYTFESRPDLLMKVLETLGSEELINKIKEEDSNKPLKFLMQTGLNKDTINQTLESMDESSRNILIDGLNNIKFVNKKEYLPIRELYKAIYKQTNDEKISAELTFKTLAKIFGVAKDFKPDEEISFNYVVGDIEKNGISIIDKKELKISKNGFIQFNHPDKTVIRKTDNIFEYIEDTTQNRIVEHIGRYPMMPDKADRIETYDPNNNLIKTWDEFGNITDYYANGRLVKRVMPEATENYDSNGRSDKEGGWSDW